MPTEVVARGNHPDGTPWSLSVDYASGNRSLQAVTYDGTRTTWGLNVAVFDSNSTLLGSHDFAPGPTPTVYTNADGLPSVRWSDRRLKQAGIELVYMGLPPP